MAKFSLIPFDVASAPKIVIECELNQTEDSFIVSYRINGDHPTIDLGNGTPKKDRTIGLWEKTCFELFIKNDLGQYLEFNFSPVFEWNCFYFSKKGDPLKEWEGMPRPETDILLSKDQFLLFSVIKKEFFPAGFLDQSRTHSAAITAVIKEKSQALSYWALSHADSRPNFHHFDSFKYKF